MSDETNAVEPTEAQPAEVPAVTPPVGDCPCTFPDTFQLGCVVRLSNLVIAGEWRSKEARHHAACIIGTFDFFDDERDDGGIFASANQQSAEQLATTILGNCTPEGLPVAGGLGTSVLVSLAIKLVTQLLERWLS